MLEPYSEQQPRRRVPRVQPNSFDAALDDVTSRVDADSAPDDATGATTPPPTRRGLPRAPASAASDPVRRVRELAPQYGIDPDLAVKIGKQESGLQHYRPDGRVKVSDQGAVGLMQVKPETGKRYGFDVNDPEQNIHAGLSYMRDIKDQWGDDSALILSGYHAGKDDALAALRNPRGNPRTHNYVRSILGN